MCMFLPFSPEQLCLDSIQQIKSLLSLHWQVLKVLIVNFQASTLDQCHHLLMNLSCKSASKHLDAISARSAVCFLQPILQFSKKTSMPPLRLRFLYARGGEPIYYHGPHELCIIACGLQNQIILSYNSTFIQLWGIVTSLDLLSKYLLTMELRFDATLCSNAKFDAGHIKCSCGPQVPHPCYRPILYLHASDVYQHSTFNGSRAETTL